MRVPILNVLTVVLLFATQHCRAAIVLTNISPAYSQDFDTLADSGTSATLPADWYFSETGPGNDATYEASDGDNGSGNTYSYGDIVGINATDRALGTLRSGALTQFVSIIGARFTNDGTAAIVALDISYEGEQWRLGEDDSGRRDRLDFEYNLTATSVADISSPWTNEDSLDFLAPQNTGTTGAKNGNDANFRSTVSSTISNVSIPPSATFWIRWTDFNATLMDDGLAVDMFNITATFATVPEPGAFLFGGLVCGVIGLAVGGRRLVGKLKGRTAE